MSTIGESDSQKNKFLDHQGNSVPIWVICLSTPKELTRKTRLINRLTYHGMIDSITFVSGVSTTDPEPKKVLEKYTNSTLPEAACMLSHLKAIASFLLLSKSPYGIIMESDAVPSNTIKDDFVNTTKSLSLINDSISTKVPLIMLNTYISGFQGIVKKNDIFQTIGSECYSGLAYMISREYAQNVLSKFTYSYVPDVNLDMCNNLKIFQKSKISNIIKEYIGASDVSIKYKPFVEYSLNDCILLDKNKPLTPSNKRVTSEIITINSGGLSTIKLLFIDESLDSSIQHQQHSEWHLNYYKHYNHTNYADADIAHDHTEILKLWGLV
ncbi:MAG: hypothetical protein Solumvirus4_16 [Solumvirus sp.]|uniref:Glycosyltransferase family 25 n=1 Tax=Solumvirus sp. TaxID=2487773 RepID=A0A3G5AGQ9_9VIRU|nr:MAG: hypothetical protein Solumvirus4_16 [Solumvirus sp.]